LLLLWILILIIKVHDIGGVISTFAIIIVLIIIDQIDTLRIV